MPDIRFHIPVSEFTIEWALKMEKYRQIRRKLQDEGSYELKLTLKTPAHPEPFEARVLIDTLEPSHWDRNHAAFTGSFQGRRVAGSILCIRNWSNPASQQPGTFKPVI